MSFRTNRRTRGIFRIRGRDLTQADIDAVLSGILPLSGPSQPIQVDIMTDTAGRKHVRITEPSGRTQFPIQYSSGRIGYDRPEVLPEYAKIQVARAFDILKGNYREKRETRFPITPSLSTLRAIRRTKLEQAGEEEPHFRGEQLEVE